MKTSTKLATQVLNKSLRIKTVEDFYNYVGLPLGTAFALKVVGEDKNIGKSNSNTDAYWREATSGEHLGNIVVENDSNGRFAFKRPDGKYLGDCCRTGGKLNWSTAIADFSDWVVIKADENAKTFYIQNDDSSKGKYIKNGTIDDLVYQGEEVDRVEFEVVSYKKHITTVADFEAYFGTGITFYLYFIDSNGEKWYIKKPNNENYDVRFIKDKTNAWENEVWQCGTSLAIAQAGGEKTFHISWDDFIHQWNKAECDENHCHLKLHIDTATDMFSIEQLQKTTSGGAHIGDHFDNEVIEVGTNDYKCGFTDNLNYKWGLEIKTKKGKNK